MLSLGSHPNNRSKISYLCTTVLKKKASPSWSQFFSLTEAIELFFSISISNSRMWHITCFTFSIPWCSPRLLGPQASEFKCSCSSLVENRSRWIFIILICKTNTTNQKIKVMNCFRELLRCLTARAIFTIKGELIFHWNVSFSQKEHLLAW